MITPQAVLSMVKHIVRRSEGYRDRRILHPRRDWLIGLAGAACLFVAGSVAAGYLFWSKNMAVGTTDAVMEDIATYDATRVERVLAEYRSRKARYSALGGGGAETAPKASSATSTTDGADTATATPERAPATVAE